MKIEAAARLSASRVIAGVERHFLKKFMHSHGYRMIGDGGQGSVWANGNSKQVLKVMYKENAREYLAFVDYVKAHPSKHAPKFYGVAEVPFSALGYKSNELPPSRFTALVSVAVERLTPKPKNYRPTAAEESSLQEYIDPMYSYADRHNLRLDIATPGNIMLRGKTLVVSDPFTTR